MVTIVHSQNNSTFFIQFQKVMAQYRHPIKRFFFINVYLLTDRRVHYVF